MGHRKRPEVIKNDGHFWLRRTSSTPVSTCDRTVTCPRGSAADESKVALSSPSSQCIMGDGQRKGLGVEARLAHQGSGQSVWGVDHISKLITGQGEEPGCNPQSLPLVTYCHQPGSPSSRLHDLSKQQHQLRTKFSNTWACEGHFRHIRSCVSVFVCVLAYRSLETCERGGKTMGWI